MMNNVQQKMLSCHPPVMQRSILVIDPWGLETRAWSGLPCCRISALWFGFLFFNSVAWLYMCGCVKRLLVAPADAAVAETEVLFKCDITKAVTFWFFSVRSILFWWSADLVASFMRWSLQLPTEMDVYPLSKVELSGNTQNIGICIFIIDTITSSCVWTTVTAVFRFFLSSFAAQTASARTAPPV